MKMNENPKKAALTVLVGMGKPGNTDAEDAMDSKDTSPEEETENTSEGESSVKCKCGCDVVCKDCNETPENCDC